MRAASVTVAAVALTVSTACMVARYEEVPSDKRHLRTGQDVNLVWPEEAHEPTPTLVIEYFSSKPSQLDDEARRVWEELRPEVEQKGVGRVAVRPTVIERGLKWRNGRPSFWTASTRTYWYGREPDGHWTPGDPEVSGTEAPPNDEMQLTRPAQATEPRS